MNHHAQDCAKCGTSRRDFVSGALAAGLTAAAPLFLQETNLAMAANAVAGIENRHPERILIVLELTGGNDGLNTVVPYSNDDYHRARAVIRIPADQALKMNDEFGFHPNLIGMHRLFQDGRMAIVHGCSYPNPNRSHFESQRFWHTGRPNEFEATGWLGRYADAAAPDAPSSYMVNLAGKQTPAIVSKRHAPVVFSNPNRYRRVGDEEQMETLAELARQREAGDNETLNFLRSVNSTAGESSEFIRNACAEFRAGFDYGRRGIAGSLRNIAAMIKAGSPARIYYTSYGSFDTHSGQGPQQSGLFNGLADSLYGFQRDLEKMGRADDVALMMFTEFGRRVAENASQGTDHGVASPMFIIGKRVNGGFYSEHPSLTDLDQGDLRMTTDFREVYATMIEKWLGFDDAKSVLKADFETLNVFA